MGRGTPEPPISNIGNLHDPTALATAAKVFMVNEHVHGE